MLIEHCKEDCSKGKNYGTCGDKMFDRASEDDARDRMFAGQLVRDVCDEEDVCQFLLLSKRQNSLQEDEDDETNENERTIVVKKQKGRAHHQCFNEVLL